MRMKKAEGFSKTGPEGPARDKKGLFLNLSGILLAFGIAFGGLALVQGRLALEKERLLEGSGRVDVLFQTHRVETQTAGEAEVGQAELTRQELVRTVEKLGEGGAVYPHEPQEGQLSMAQAVECGKGWIEEFLLPRLGMAAEEGGEREYRASGFLWTSVYDSVENIAENPWLSYWTVRLASSDIDAVLILEAATGQLLNMKVNSRNLIEHQESDEMLGLLKDYAESVGIGTDYALVDKGSADSWSRGYRCGDGEIFACADVGSIAVSSGEGSMGHVAQEYVYIALWLEWEDTGG